MKRAIGALALILAGCTPTAEQDDYRARCGLLEGPNCRKSVPGDLPPGITEIGKVAKRCSPPRYCGPLGFVDCNSPTDGPAYYFERESGKIIGYCGGYCMMQGEQCEKSCPPPGWTCKG
jgi:hypothetical protein